MWPTSHRSKKERASSFTSCLLTLVVVFGGIGFYYFNYFQWRFFENPVDGLTYAKVDAAGMNDFRKRAVADLIDPTRQQLDRIKQMRTDTKKGTAKYAEFDQHVKEVRNRLLAIINEGRLRRVPEPFKKEYNKAMMALKDAFDSINELQECFDAETEGERARIYEGSFKKWQAGWKKVNDTKEYFNGDAWQSAVGG